MPVSVRLEQADVDTLRYVETLLEEFDLPSRDVRSKPDAFYVGYDGADRVGIGGVEINGTDGLLRSVVIEPPKRGTGFGAALCEALETKARANGVTALYLLTTTASGFFENRGYVEIQRSDAPNSITQTAEFRELCPTSATSMKKSLSKS